LPVAPEEQQQRGDRQAPIDVLERQRCTPRGDLLEVERAEAGEDQQRAEDEAEVADAVDDEGLLAGVAADFFLNQKPISRYEQRPTPSQPTNITGKSSRAPAPA
jgi:hypothetical protein